MAYILHQKFFYELTTDELYELLKVRCQVFIVEQQILCQELDDDDKKALHIWMTDADDGRILALCRAFPAGTHLKEASIGRVLTTERGKGYGLLIMQAAIRALQEHYQVRRIDIEAQRYAKAFYEKSGFRQTTDEYILEGIPHIDMTWTGE